MNASRVAVGAFIIALIACVGVWFQLFSERHDVSAIPFLADAPNSEGYELHFLGDNYLRNITYDIERKFYLLDTDDLTKFNEQGQQVHHVPFDAEGSVRIKLSPFVVTQDGIYDLGDATPKPYPITQKVNAKKDKRLTQQSFDELYSDAYSRADTVVYGDYNDEIGRIPAYMRIDEEWIVFYLDHKTSDIEQNYELGYQVADYPAKPQTMVLLYDNAQDIYARAQYDRRESNRPATHIAKEYVTDPSLTILQYQSEEFVNHAAYIGIPQSRSGPAVHRLLIQGEVIDFKEVATRDIFSFQVNRHLNFFVGPKEAAAIGFLEFAPSNNRDTYGGDGLYILRPKVPN